VTVVGWVVYIHCASLLLLFLELYFILIAENWSLLAQISLGISLKH